ncbi:hypothetical protein GQ42DRAFT_160541 [Ramicandelaber brevisporus]|nr:hypothetical protein GQ42DRAFT_160541 [Ramicandelaber brevisporus]
MPVSTRITQARTALFTGPFMIVFGICFAGIAIALSNRQGFNTPVFVPILFGGAGLLIAIIGGVILYRGIKALYQSNGPSGEGGYVINTANNAQLESVVVMNGQDDIGRRVENCPPYERYAWNDQQAAATSNGQANNWAKYQNYRTEQQPQHQEPQYLQSSMPNSH